LRPISNENGSAIGVAVLAFVPMLDSATLELGHKEALKGHSFTACGKTRMMVRL
jgi:hypothetical protein